ncbi:MAG: galactonate dehydratase [Candidatus Hydrogenedentes bacterium]|nr:galactonate dehydratase [Candidatus Hydrogenedentota bacterium]
MKITKVEAFPVPPRWVFCKVETDQGITGWGEPSLEGHAATQVAAVAELARVLVGEDPLRIEHLWQGMYRWGFYRGGPVLMSALSGVDHALWDIFGKSVGLPVHQLLGGACRDKVRVYGGCGGSEPAQLRESAQACVAAGFTAMKFCPVDATEIVDGFDVIKKVEARMAAAREGAGDADVALDFHGRISPPMAIALADALRPYHPFFIEEPVQCENVDALVRVARSTPIPIATGERLYGTHGFREVIEKDAASILQPDLSHAGGITEVRKIAAMANTHYMAIAPHCPLGPVSLAACIQFALCTPNFLIQEHGYLGQGYLKNPFTVTDGYLSIPTAPGLGIEVDEEAVRAMPWQDWDTPRLSQTDGSVADW